MCACRGGGVEFAVFPVINSSEAAGPRSPAPGPAAAEPPPLAAPRPHILVIIIDDWGWANAGWHRTPADDPDGEVQTPAMNALVAEGIELNQSYAFWYCAPSRSALQTGRNPIHVLLYNDDSELNHNPLDPVSGFAGVPRNMTTIAWKMREANYSTHYYGKYHIGMATADHAPAGRGYESAAVYFNGMNDYWQETQGLCPPGRPANGSQPIVDLYISDAAGGRPGWGLNGSQTCNQTNQAGCVFEDTVFTERLLAAIAAHDTSRPFFGVFAPHSVHGPLQVPDEWLDRFAFIDVPARRMYAAMVAFVDAQVGRVVDALKARGMYETTLIVLQSDNGGPIFLDGSAGANNWPLRGGKASNFQGGVRVNAFVSGGFVPPARRGAVHEGFVEIADWFRTFCGLAGVDPFDARGAAAGLPPVEGVDQWPVLSGANATWPRSEVVIGAPPTNDGEPLGVQGVIDSDGYKLLVGTLHACP